jgi:hypothetical protein
VPAQGGLVRLQGAPPGCLCHTLTTVVADLHHLMSCNENGFMGILLANKIGKSSAI